MAEESPDPAGFDDRKLAILDALWTVRNNAAEIAAQTRRVDGAADALETIAGLARDTMAQVDAVQEPMTEILGQTPPGSRQPDSGQPPPGSPGTASGATTIGGESAPPG